MPHFKLIIGLVFASIVLIFAVQNAAVVEIRFLFWSLALSRIFLIFGTLAIGVIIGWMLCSYFSYYRKPSGKQS
ncbi:MAG: LapA family protein [Desulfatitalea sp.]|nr:LapA family protein [Desulfatitalea sp.]NNK00925.1 LapA family protein [Desulfatitalea sp.]